MKWGYFPPTYQTVTICILIFSILILIASWRQTVLLVTLSCCGFLPSFQIWRSRGNPPNGLREKSLWHDTNQKSPFIFFSPSWGIKACMSSEKWGQAEQSRAVLGSQSGSLQVLRSFLRTSLLLHYSESRSLLFS